MAKRVSNVGETGASSIRLKGQRIEDLPLGLGNQAKEQLLDVHEVERLNAIAEINAQYPHQRVDYMSARINECEANKNRMRKMIAETHGRIQEYRGLIMQCDMRDKLLADLLCSICHLPDSDHGHGDERHEYTAPVEERKEILTRWGRWDADALRQQIEQDEEALGRFEDVIRQEDESIKEHSQIISLCRERDKKLAKLGAKPDGS